MKRAFDFVFAILTIIVLVIPMLLIGVAIKLSSRGPVLHISQRVGRDNRLFDMFKFRTMRVGTPIVATHLLVAPLQAVTPLGAFLRSTSLDELPQLLNILVGDMSFVGPRPALSNQNDLIALRTDAGVHTLIPGLTGWAQVNGRDENSIEEKVRLDCQYKARQSFSFDLKILWLTALPVIRRRGVAH
jgi:O-antigen biosynthesis protein WbqP